MKIRIKGNSVRFRLTKTEVGQPVSHGRVGDTTTFGHAVFAYEVVVVKDVQSLMAEFDDNTIRMVLPHKMGRNWDKDDRVGFMETIPYGDGTELHLLLEKDFSCLEYRGEDETDLYPNPKAQ